MWIDSPLRREKALSCKAFSAAVRELCGRSAGVEVAREPAGVAVTETPPG